MPQRPFQFRPGPEPAVSVPATPAPVEPAFAEVLKAMAEDDPFGGMPDEPVRIQPQPRLRIASAAMASQASAAHLSGTAARDNPFLDRVSINKFDVNPYQILHDLKNQ